MTVVALQVNEFLKLPVAVDAREGTSATLQLAGALASHVKIWFWRLQKAESLLGSQPSAVAGPGGCQAHLVQILTFSEPLHGNHPEVGGCGIGVSGE